MATILRGSDNLDSSKVLSEELAGSIVTDASGRVTMPYQPFVYLTAANHIAGDTGETWTKISTAGAFTVSSSVGTEWNNTTNTYTVQKAGVYRIMVNHLSYGQAHSRVSINGVDFGQSHSRANETNYCATSGVNVLRYLSAGDYIEFGCYLSSAGYIYGYPYSHFSIRLEQ